MRTVGVDLSASPGHTAVAVIEWTDQHAVVSGLVMPADDTEVIATCVGATRVGIDAPFGWPDEFVDFVVAHRRGHTADGRGLDDIENRRPLVFRRTDRHLIDSGQGRPLSVSADQIAHVAFRCAGLLAELGVSDRVDGWAIEAYPAAALRRWGLRSQGYKRPANRDRLRLLVDELEAAAPWLILGEHAPRMASDDNAFDAVITALIARAAQAGLTEAPDAADMPVAAREGWIHLPRAELAALSPRNASRAAGPPADSSP